MKVVVDLEPGANGVEVEKAVHAVVSASLAASAAVRVQKTVGLGRWLSPKQLAERTPIGETTWKELIRSKKITASKIGKSWAVEESVAREFMRRHQISAETTNPRASVLKKFGIVK